MEKFTFSNGYSEINGIEMYYEIYGKGKPIVLLHGGGSTIQSNFEKIIPLLAKNRKVIAIELQAHGRTSDRNSDLSFEQDADDVASLLSTLEIHRTDILGFSNGGTTTIQIAIRHPHIVDKIILASALAKRNGMPDWFWKYMDNASLENMPIQLQQAYHNVSSKPNGLQVMHDKDVKRMLEFKDIPEDKINSIEVPTLLVIGDKDVISIEHTLELHKLITNSKLAIIPGGHGEYIGEITTITSSFKESELIVPLLEKFLNN